MVKTRTLFRCEICAATVPRWVGRCPSCEEWHSLREEIDLGTKSPVARDHRPIQALSGVGGGDGQPVPTGLAEVDRVLGGGLVPGSVTLIGGEPGVGKSTLVLQLLAAAARRGGRCLLVTGEESPHQVRTRADRLDAVVDGVDVLAETAMPAIAAAVEASPPTILAVDSIQTVADPEVPGVPGSLTQVREGAHRLVRLAKEHDVAVVLVGHVTKEGELSGPRTLEHVVDTVLTFDGDRHHALRLLRVVKHRFGSTAELGLLEMRGDGLSAVPDPSALFLADRRPGMPGSVVAAVMEGGRPLLVEVQALVADAPGPVPRRTAQGIDGGRLAMLAAVVARWGSVTVGARDLFVSVAGGLRVQEPGVDLAVALAIIGAVTDRAVPPDTVVVGELGLAGEVRQVAQLPRRLSEAARLGFRRAVVPVSCPPVPGVEICRADGLGVALAAAGGA